MGLEAGWNCHISLGSQKKGGSTSTSTPNTRKDSQSDVSHKPSRFSSRHSTDSLRQSQPITARHSRDSVRMRRSSAPSAIYVDSIQVKFESEVDKIEISPVKDSDSAMQYDGHCNHELHRRTSSPQDLSPRRGSHYSNGTHSIDQHEPLLQDNSRKVESDNTSEVAGEHSELLSGEYMMDRVYRDDEDVYSESHHTASCVTENTEDSVTAALENRVSKTALKDIRGHCIPPPPLSLKITILLSV